MAIEMWNNQTVIFRRPQGDSDQSTVTALPNGNFVVVWRDGMPGQKGIKFQIVNAAGEPVGPVAHIPVADPSDPEVIALSDGGFRIGWSGGSSTIETQRYDVNGVAVGGLETLAAAQATHNQQSPALVADGDLRYAAVWADTSGATNAIRFVYTVPGDSFPVSINAGAGAKNPDVARLSNGKHVVVLSEGNNSDIKAVIIEDYLSVPPVYRSVTIPTGTGTTDILGNGTKPLVTAINDGFNSFVVTYRDSSGNLNVRKFNGDGVAVPNDLLLDTGVTDYPFQVVELTKGGFDGGFAIAYSKNVNGAEKLYLKLVKYDDASIPPVAIQPPEAGTALISSITELADGRISVVWDTPSDGAGGIYNRIIDAREADVTVNGTSGADYYIGTKFTGDALLGHGGNDRLEGGAGADEIDGGEGTGDTAEFRFATAGVAANLTTNTGTAGDAAGDVYVGIENFYGSRYNDALVGDAGVNRLTGWTGNDVLDGADGADILDGDAGNDILIGGAGADALLGGSEIDTVDYSRATGAVTVNLANGTGSGSDAQGDTYSSIENVVGSNFGDIFIGNAAANAFQGLGGNDSYHVSAGDAVIEAAGGGHDKVFVDTSYILGANVEDLEGTGGGALALTGNELNNTITGNAAGNWIDGGIGADTMAGGAGDDTYVIDNAGDRIVDDQGVNSVILTVSYDLSLLPSSVRNVTMTEGLALNLTGTSGANVLMGNVAANTLSGLGGNDTIYGKGGNDRLFGGSGKDVFVFDTAPHKTRNVDRIYDFKSSDDSFHLDNKYFTKLGKGTPTKPVKFKSDMFVEGKKAQDREDRIVYDKKTGSLYYDKDGAGGSAQVKIATINNKTKLYYHDFFVI